MIKCNRCGSEVKQGQKFCTRCGLEIKITQAKCSNCGHQIKEGDRFCTMCGCKVEVAKAKCSNCGQEIEEKQKFCTMCGCKVINSSGALTKLAGDDGQKDYSLFHKVSAGYFLKYQYEKDLCMIEDVMDFIVGNGGKEIKFVQEPENEYDDKAVAIYLGDKKLGYVYKGQIQDMINDFITRGDAVVGYINKYSKNENTATYKVGFYRPLSLCESKQYTLAKTGKKVDEYTKRSENLEYCNEGEEITVSFDYESDSYVVYNSLYDEIGELPKKAMDFIGDTDEDSIGGTFDSLDYDENDRPKAKVTIYLIK